MLNDYHYERVRKKNEIDNVKANSTLVKILCSWLMSKRFDNVIDYINTF